MRIELNEFRRFTQAELEGLNEFQSLQSQADKLADYDKVASIVLKGRMYALADNLKESGIFVFTR